MPATVTLHEAHGALQALAKQMRGEPGSEVLVDASALQIFDSAALAVLLECARLAQASSRPFSVSSAPAKLIDLARLYGVEGLLGLRPA